MKNIWFLYGENSYFRKKNRNNIFRAQISKIVRSIFVRSAPITKFGSKNVNKTYGK